MRLDPGDNDKEPTMHEIANVVGIMEQELPPKLVAIPDKDINDAAGVGGPMKKFGGRLKTIMDPASRNVLVVKEMVVIPVVDLCARLSPDAKTKPIFEICPPMADVENKAALLTSELVATVKPVATASLGAPVVSCPAAKVMDCAPAGSAALAVVHTMTRVAAVIAHPDNVAAPDTGLRLPSGVDGPVK